MKALSTSCWRSWMLHKRIYQFLIIYFPGLSELFVIKMICYFPLLPSFMGVLSVESSQ
jgi:hypothetical protein